MHIRQVKIHPIPAMNLPHLKSLGRLPPLREKISRFVFFSAAKASFSSALLSWSNIHKFPIPHSSQAKVRQLEAQLKAAKKLL